MLGLEPRGSIQQPSSMHQGWVLSRELQQQELGASSTTCMKESFAVAVLEQFSLLSASPVHPHPVLLGHHELCSCTLQ